jgi:hypothetical protein
MNRCLFLSIARNSVPWPSDWFDQANRPLAMENFTVLISALRLFNERRCPLLFGNLAHNGNLSGDYRNPVFLRVSTLFQEKQKGKVFIVLTISKMFEGRNGRSVDVK